MEPHLHHHHHLLHLQQTIFFLARCFALLQEAWKAENSQLLCQKSLSGESKCFFGRQPMACLETWSWWITFPSIRLGFSLASFAQHGGCLCCSGSKQTKELERASKSAMEARAMCKVLCCFDLASKVSFGLLQQACSTQRCSH